MEPILKWAGGKRQLYEELTRRFPESFNHYHEPMIGGGALFFRLELTDGSINDTNPRLMNFYKQVRDHPNEVIEYAKSFKFPTDPPAKNRPFTKNNRKGKPIKNYYYQQREIFNNRPFGDEFDPIEEAALFLYLNRTCYNGLYRENSSGGFNVPIGRYKNPDWVRESEILTAHKILQNIKIFNQDFSYILDIANEGDLVYLDPPYEPMSATANFTSYSMQGFDQEEQERLLKLVLSLTENQIHVLMSNSGIMYEKYQEYGFEVEIENARRAINSDPEKRGHVEEIIATNYSLLSS